MSRTNGPFGRPPRPLPHSPLHQHMNLDPPKKADVPATTTVSASSFKMTQDEAVRKQHSADLFFFKESRGGGESGRKSEKVAFWVSGVHEY